METAKDMQNPILDVKGLKKYFPVKKGLHELLLRTKINAVRAVDGISFQLGRAQILGLVGESGCGKTTAGRTLLRLIEPTDGQICYQGQDITGLSKREMKVLRRDLQIIFQDPYDSMNPRKNILNIVSEPLYIQKMVENRQQAKSRAVSALAEAGLTPPDEYLGRFPHELSGGQRQRVAIARTLILEPSFVVADEPVSMLDVSIRGSILNLMRRMVEERGVSFLYITHDLATARQICDRIAVMYLGRIVEICPAGGLARGALHPYSQALVAAVLSPDPTRGGIVVRMAGEVPDPAAPPSGCHLHPRCPRAKARCKREIPQLEAVESGHLVRCFFPG